MKGALPTFVIIGAMKSGTTALHRLLGHHPQIAVSNPKELNFFFGAHPPATDAADPWAAGNHWRGLDWYARHFRADVPVRGEASPGYTSPAHPGVAELMAAALPEARLLYLVRDPIARAVSQYRHHRRDGTEQRPLADALLDPDSQYLARSRYHERLRPFLDRFPRAHIRIVAAEDLRDAGQATLHAILWFLGADAVAAPAQRDTAAPAHTTDSPDLPAGLRDRLAALLRDDASRLRAVSGEPFTGWTV